MGNHSCAEVKERKKKRENKYKTQKNKHILLTQFEGCTVSGKNKVPLIMAWTKKTRLVTSLLCLLEIELSWKAHNKVKQSIL